MPSRTLNSDLFLTLSHDADNLWLYADWHGLVNSEDVMTGSLRILDAFRRERCSKLLNDNTNLSGMWADAAIWGAHEILPQFYQVGCRHIAWVHSSEIYSRLSTSLIVDDTTAGIVLKPFDDLLAARNWLSQVGQPAADKLR